MSFFWVVGTASLLTLGWLALVVIGVVREVDRLRRRLDLLEKALPGRVNRTGLPVGTVVPDFEGQALDGETVSSEDYRGEQHLVLFAHPGCTPCEQLVPILISRFVQGDVPPAIVVTQGDVTVHPNSWRQNGSSGGLRVLMQDRHSIAKKFGTFITPHLFVINPDGRVGAQGIVNSVGGGEGLSEGSGATRPNNFCWIGNESIGGMDHE